MTQTACPSSFASACPTSSRTITVDRTIFGNITACCRIRSRPRSSAPSINPNWWFDGRLFRNVGSLAAPTISHIGICYGQHAVIESERADRALMRGVRLETEHDVPSVIDEQLVQAAMYVHPMRADMDAAHFLSQKVDARRKDQDFGLLDVGFQVVDPIERSDHVFEGHTTEQFDLRHRVTARQQVLLETRGVVQDQVAQCLFSSPLVDKGVD